MICICLLGANSFNSPANLIFPDFPDDKEEYHFISFNAWALPVWIPKSEQIKRYRRIPYELLTKNADIICIQEAFARKFRKKLLPLLSEQYYSYSDYLCNKRIAGPILKDCYGGLITFSRYPIIEEIFYPYPIYESMRLEEKMGEKGFLLSTIDSPNGVINVINTHLYSGLNKIDEWHRSIQISFMDSILRSRPDLDLYPLFLLGDLNVRHPDIAFERVQPASRVYARITQDMNFIDPARSFKSEYYTIDKSLNKYSGMKNGSQKLDYCMYRPARNILVKLKDQCTAFTREKALSDHMGWETFFHFLEIPSDLKTNSEVNQVATLYNIQDK